MECDLTFLIATHIITDIFQENMKNSNSSHDVVDGRNGGQENGKTPNNQSSSYTSLPHDVNGANKSERDRENNIQAETAETEERRRTAHRVFSKQGSVHSSALFINFNNLLTKTRDNDYILYL